MIKHFLKILSLSILFSQAYILSQSTTDLSQNKLNIFLFDQEILDENKKKIKSNDKTLIPAFKKLYAYAELGLTKGPYSVTKKIKLPPSGDKHDYMSLGPYWWPDPDKPDGLPYIRKDGQVNPEVFKFTDKQQLVEMCLNVKLSSLAYFFTEEERFAEHAVKLLKIWFIDEETKMNPNFNFGQSIPGLSDGRAVGLIESRHFTEVIDAVGLVQNSDFWNDELAGKLKQWFEKYFTWLTEKELGKEESEASNNHGSWYDVQAASVALYLGKNQYVRNIIEEAKLKRIDAHIEPDGKQPEELARTRSLSYSSFNLEALFSLAQLGKYVAVDLWNYESPKGASLKKAFDFLLPFYLEEKDWEYAQIKDFENERIYGLILQASNNFNENNYKKVSESLHKQNKNDLANLIHKKQ